MTTYQFLSFFCSEETEGNVNLKVMSTSTFAKALQLNEIQLAQQRRRKSFRLEWLDVPEFKDWLSPDPDSPFKARCLACNTILNAGKSELEKHAAGAKHEKAVESLKRMVLEQQAWDESNDMEDEGEFDWPGVATCAVFARHFLFLGVKSYVQMAFFLILAKCPSFSTKDPFSLFIIIIITTTIIITIIIIVIIVVIIITIVIIIGVIVIVVVIIITIIIIVIIITIIITIIIIIITIIILLLLYYYY